MEDSMNSALRDVLDGKAEGEEVMKVGALEMEMVRGRTVATRVMGKYPLKFMVPSKVARAGVDAVWVYVITYGGGIVSGDAVAFTLTVGTGCTGVLTTQASTKIYHSSEGKNAQQRLDAVVRDGALLAVLPDPVTCFRDAKYVQDQTFKLAPGGSLVLVDWLTSGRRERDEVWAFDSYLSSNSVLVEGRPPLLLDKVNLSTNGASSVAERMCGLHVVGLVVLCGPRVKDTWKSMEAAANGVARASLGRGRSRGQMARTTSEASEKDPVEGRLWASCSVIGTTGEALLVRLAAATTETVYKFLRAHLAPLSSQLGAEPYASLG